MIYYVFITYGAVSIQNAARYPAAAVQLECFVKLRKTPEGAECSCAIEKAASIEALASLPKLKAALKTAQVQNSKVIIDDFRRILSQCPVDHRRRLLREIDEFAAVFYELRDGGRCFAELTVDDRRELRSLNKAFRGKRRSHAKNETPKSIRRLLTSTAREASIASRKNTADGNARYIRRLHDRLLATQESITLQDIANILNSRDYQTSRGGTWSAATVKRMLDRAKKLEGET